MTSITIHLSLTSSPSTPRSSLVLTSSTTSNELRTKVSQQTNVPLDKLKLIFRGRMINNSNNSNGEGEGKSVIEEYKLEDGSVIHVMGKPVAVGTSNNNNSEVNSSNSTTINQTAGASVTLPNNNLSATGVSSTSSTATSSISGGGALAAALTKLRSQNDGPTFRTALTTADKLLGNIVNNPMEEKYRSIKKSNPAFSKRLGSLVGGHELLLAAGFTITTKNDDNDGKEIEYYTLVPSETAWPTLVKAKEEVNKLLLSENQTSATSTTASISSGGGWDGTGIPPSTVTSGLGAPGSGLPSFGAGMGGGMGGQQPDMAQMQSMLSDPNMMQRVMSMANNPMVQQMMQNDPRFANNPMLQQSLQALQSNPDLMNQMSSMMANPQARQHMASMVAQQAAATQQRQQQQGGAAASGGGTTDPFANGMRDQFQQMQNQSGGLTPEQLQRMMSQFGNLGGSNNGGATASGTTATSTNGNSSTTNNNNNNTSNGGSNGNASSSGNENEMTEEEMINEAIARSLRES